MIVNKKLMYILIGLAMLTLGIAWTSAKIVNEYLHYNKILKYIGTLIVVNYND